MDFGIALVRDKIHSTHEIDPESFSSLKSFRFPSQFEQDDRKLVNAFFFQHFTFDAERTVGIAVLETVDDFDSLALLKQIKFAFVNRRNHPKATTLNPLLDQCLQRLILAFDLNFDRSTWQQMQPWITNTHLAPINVIR